MAMLYYDKGDEEKDHKIFKKLAEEEHGKSQCQLGIMYLDNKDYKETQKWWKKANENGCMDMVDRKIKVYSTEFVDVQVENIKLKEEISKLKEEIKYMPFGEGYEQAKLEFEEIVTK